MGTNFAAKERVMSKSAYATYRGLSPSMITKYLKSGTIVTTSDGLIVVEASDVLLDNFTKSGLRANKVRKYDKSKSKKKIVEDFDDSYLKARADLTRYKAEQAKLEYEVMAGSHVSNDTVSLNAFNCARRTRDAVLKVPDRLGAILAAESDVLNTKKLLKEELISALEEVITNLKEEVCNG